MYYILTFQIIGIKTIYPLFGCIITTTKYMYTCNDKAIRKYMTLYGFPPTQIFNPDPNLFSHLSLSKKRYLERHVQMRFHRNLASVCTKIIFNTKKLKCMYTRSTKTYFSNYVMTTPRKLFFFHTDKPYFILA